MSFSARRLILHLIFNCRSALAGCDTRSVLCWQPDLRAPGLGPQIAQPPANVGSAGNGITTDPQPFRAVREVRPLDAVPRKQAYVNIFSCATSDDKDTTER